MLGNAGAGASADADAGAGGRCLALQQPPPASRQTGGSGARRLAPGGCPSCSALSRPIRRLVVLSVLSGAQALFSV